MDIIGTFKKTMNEELTSQKEAKKAAKAAKREARSRKEPLSVRFMANIKAIAATVLYSMLMLSFSYCLVMLGTMYLPSILDYILKSFGSSTLMMSVQMACLFFTLWFFAFTFWIIRTVGRIYVKGVKAAFAKKNS